MIDFFIFRILFPLTLVAWFAFMMAAWLVIYD